MSHRFGPRTRLIGSAVGSRVAQWDQRSLIKSIQRSIVTIGAGATSATTAITSVVLTNSVIRFLGYVAQGAATTPNITCVRAELTNATTVTAAVNSTGAGDRIASFEVIEYWPGVVKTVQRGTFTTTAATSGTATITSVNTAKATLDFLGFTTDEAVVTDVGLAGVDVVLTNATTVTGTGVGGINRVIGYQVVEWF